MTVHELTPILNVSDMTASFTWFETIGWKKLWDWGTPPTFGAVGCGNVEIFLCLGAQGSRGGPIPKFAGDDETGGVWMSWFLKSKDDVDAAYAHAVKHGLNVTHPPTDEPWGVREFHLRHPDGHTFRVGSGTECE
jgi:predicted enzyme related to lactoylglutathione lyase